MFSKVLFFRVINICGCEIQGKVIFEFCCLTLSQTRVFTCLQIKPSENTVGKGEIARNEQFLLFPQCFLSHFGEFSSNVKLSSANSFSFEGLKICHLGKG